MHPVYAEDLKQFSPTKINDLGELVNVVVRNAFVIAGVVALFLLIFGGFSFIIAAGSGDAKGMDKGKQAITAALVGLILIVLSVALVNLVGMITGLSLLGEVQK